MARRIPPGTALEPAPIPVPGASAPGSGERAAPAVLSRTRVAFVGITTSLRLALTLVVAALLLSGHDRTAAVVFAIAAGTDYVDGSLARRWQVTTATGSFLDTTADKVLVSGVLIALTGTGEASPWPVLLIVAREMVVLGLRGSVAAAGTVVSASSLGRSKTAFQFLAIVLLILRVSPRLGPLGLDAWVLWLATALTLISGADYLVRWAGITVRGPAGRHR